MMRNIPEERTHQLRGGGSLTSHILCCLAAVTGHCSSIAKQKPIPDKATKNRTFFNVPRILGI
jgi:hypothetical protein